MAFPLISAKIFRGNRDLGGLLEISLDALVDGRRGRVLAQGSSAGGVLVAGVRTRFLAAAWRAKTLQKRPRTAYAPRARQTPKKAKAAIDDLTSDTSGGGRVAAGQEDDGPVDLTEEDGAVAPKRKAPDAPASLDLTIDDGDDAAPRGRPRSRGPRTATHPRPSTSKRWN